MKGESIMRSLLRATLVAAALPWAGCEETLEACAPCGLPSEGAVNVSGDPRLDGVIEAIGRVWQWGKGVEAGYDASLDAVAHAVGYAHEEAPGGKLKATAGDVDQIAALLRAVFFEQAGITTTIDLESPRCAVDTELALARQLSCESASDCYIGSTCGDALGSCTGLCVGRCATASGAGGEDMCGGSCYRDVDAGAADEECLAECIGTCASGTIGSCPGRCRGTCSAPCSAYTADGDCDGACSGECGGACTSGSPVACDGPCYGSCLVAEDPEDGCTGTCRGDCALGVCDGACLGHLRPEGCDLASRCSGVLACQETGKDLAWAYMRCDSATARVHVAVDAAFTGDVPALLALAALLERTLEVLLDDYGRISILVEGVDPLGEIGPSDLFEPADDARPYAVKDHALLVAAGVPDDRADLPLFAMRARASWLAVEATGGEYEISAGSMPCVRPAFEDALALADALIPIEERDTSGSDPGAWPDPVIDRTRGLFRVLDGATVLLGLNAEVGR